MSLVFETAAALPGADPHRADVACFVGFVARRRTRLPQTIRTQLEAAGWVRGNWAKTAAQIEALENLPVTVDSWDLFDQLFAWDKRPLKHDGDAVCASYLGAAVRSFFARGGKRAVIVRVGDPWPFVESASHRALNRRMRLRALIPDFPEHGEALGLFDPLEPGSWQGLHQLYSLRENSMLVMPDLADACSVEPKLPKLTATTPDAPEIFVECSEDEPVSRDTGLRHTPAPRLDNAGFTAWKLAITLVRDFLRRYQREVMLLAALPLPHVDTHRIASGDSLHAQADMLTYLQHIGVLNEDGSVGSEGMASAFVQLASPWLRTQAASDLPEGLESPDGVLAGLIAAGANERGCFHSVAGDFSVARLRDVSGAEPVPSWGQGDDSPDGMLARHVCLITQSPEGWMLQSDVTTAGDEAWRFGGASRLMGCIVRAARSTGDSAAFEPNGPKLWSRVRRAIEDMLTEFWREGAFSGDRASEAFSVACDRSTMTQNDLDAGRLIVRVSVQPAMSIERITVVLNLGNTADAGILREVA